MSDRPDWLPEPTTPPVRPLSERLHLGAISVASLLLAIWGTVLVLSALLSAGTVLRGSGRLFPIRIAAGSLFGGLVSLALAYLLRWCLRRERERQRKA